MKAQSNWRGELSEYAGVLSNYDGYGDLTKQNPKTDTKARKEIKEKPVNNKILINPVVAEAFGEIGAVVLDIHEEAVVEELSKEDIEELQRKKDAKEGKKPGKVDEDSKWIQKATKNMRKDKPCTGDKFGSDTCPPGSKRYNLAKTFKKMAKEEAIHENKAEVQAATLRTKRAMLNLKVSKAEQKAEKERTKTGKSMQVDLNQQQAAEETVYENEDSLRDRRMERGGVDGNTRYDRPSPNKNSEWGKKKPSGKSAIDVVKAQIRAKHGDKAIIEPKKKDS